ncbi:MAG: hypothetical protein ABH986_00550 [archaeon]
MQKLREEILEKGKLSEKELNEKIREKVKKFSGMLNEEAALYLIARETGVNSEQEYKTISEIKSNETVNLKAEIVSVYPEREFESKGKKGKVKNALIKDKTGEATLVLWNNDTTMLSEKDEGKRIELKEFSAGEFNGRLQLKKGFNGVMELKEKINEKETETKTKNISEVKEWEKNVSVQARVLKEFPLKEFESNGKNGMLKRIELIDGTGAINAVLWNEKAKEKITEGKAVELKGFNAKKNFGAIELHSAESSQIKELQETALKELKELCINFFGKTELNNAGTGQKFVASGKIKGLNKTRLLFNVCPECGKKLEEENNSFFCRNCGQVLKPERKLVVSFELEDETALMNAIVYGKKAETIIGKTTKEIETRAEEIIIEELIKELNEEIRGKEVSFLARTKNNSFTGETELVLEKLF